MLVGRVGLRWVGLGEEKLALKLMLFIVMSCVLPAPPAFECRGESCASESTLTL